MKQCVPQRYVGSIRKQRFFVQSITTSTSVAISTISELFCSDAQTFECGVGTLSRVTAQRQFWRETHIAGDVDVVDVARVEIDRVETLGRAIDDLKANSLFDRHVDKQRFMLQP